MFFYYDIILGNWIAYQVVRVKEGRYDYTKVWKRTD